MSRDDKELSVALVQMSVTPDPADNLARAISRVEEAGRAGAQVVCLPELFKTPYFCQKEDASFFDLAEGVPGTTTELLGKVAARAKTVIVAPLFERRAAGVYHNSAAVVDADGKLLGLYRKMHIPDDPAYYEKFYFTPGDLGYRTFQTRHGRIGVLICWDQWYPEAARLTALQGAGILLYPTAIGWHPQEKQSLGAAQRDAWQTVQRGHAVANGVYVAAVNRIGLEKPDAASEGLEFWGSSFIADPQGQVVAEAAADREEVLYGVVDPHRIEDVRRNWPFLRDRRIDSYGGITSRYMDEGPPA
jgi:N-carbamoylputrescine amidase